MSNNDKKDNKKSGKVVNKRASSLKIFSVSSVIVFLAIILVLNILLSMTVEKKIEFDLTTSTQNSISDVSIDYINSLPANTKIRIVGLFDLPSTLPRHLEYSVPMLDNLAAKSNGRITVDYIDPDKVPTIIKELDPSGVASLEKGMFAVSCNGKVRMFDPYYDCFVFDPKIREQYGEDYPLQNIAEETVISNIVSLTSDSGFKVYYLTGIGEAEHTFMDRIFDSMNIQTEELYVNEPFVVPDDCDLLIINNPNVDITESVQEGLKAYVKNNARPVNMIVSLGITSENMYVNFDHINNVLTEVNLAVEPTLVKENTPEYIINSNNGDFKGILANEYSDYNSFGVVRYKLARSIIETSRASSNISSSPIIVTSSDASLLAADAPEQSTSNAVIAAKGYYVGTTNPVNIYVFGTGTLTTDEYLLAASANDPNIQVIKKIITSLINPNVNFEIAPKPISDYSLDITKIDLNTISTISVVFIAVIPFAMVIIAAIVYNKRSHL